ncbi:flagellar export chaperone FliS [Verrucomicrobia bacterium S94]|nr:flagellar export chaperone FliS [Verrucomicrobia bacterium S94]
MKVDQKEGCSDMAELNQYQKIAVNTATAMELVLMVYDECIRSLEKAEEAFKLEGPERIEPIGKHLRHAQNAITELSVSLNMEQGGEIAENLSRLYDFMINHLSRANVKKELQPVRDVKDMMVDLREAWVQVAEQAPVLSPEPPSGSHGGGRISLAG